MGLPFQDAWQVLVRAAWHDDPVIDPPQEVLCAAIRLAHLNDVTPILVQAYPDRFVTEHRAVQDSVSLFHRNLGEACALLDAAAVPAILIKALPSDQYIYSNFDLVVGDDGWEQAVAALTDWAVRTSEHPLERTKLLLYPIHGPAVHLHRSVAWFDIPVISTTLLRARARRPESSPCLLPDSADALRILLAHAAFQNLSLTLGELRTYRYLVTHGSAIEAARLAATEGWSRGFANVADTAEQTIGRLDALVLSPLPARLPVLGSVLAGIEHAVHLARSGRRATAVRELVLRGPLIAAKRRAALRSR